MWRFHESARHPRNAWRRDPSRDRRALGGDVADPETSANPDTMFQGAKPMSEANNTAVVAFYRQALMEGDVEKAFRLYAGPAYRQHNPLIEQSTRVVIIF
jgi:hypothetical protein